MPQSRRQDVTARWGVARGSYRSVSSMKREVSRAAVRIASGGSS